MAVATLSLCCKKRSLQHKCKSEKKDAQHFQIFQRLYNYLVAATVFSYSDIVDKEIFLSSSLHAYAFTLARQLMDRYYDITSSLHCCRRKKALT